MAVLDYSQQVPAADRALTILEIVAGAPDGLTTAELLTEVGGSRSGLYALLNTLKTRDFVATEDGRHRPGPALHRLLPERPDELESLVAAFRQETDLERFDETVALTWPDHHSTVVVAESPGPRVLRAVYRTGDRRPATSPDARLFAAASPDQDDDLGDIRQRGIATSDDGEVAELAAPVCADGVRPTAAVVAGVPVTRAGPETVEALGSLLRQVAARLSYRLGAMTYQPYGWVGTEEVGPSRELGPAELDEFLSGLWGAQLACIRPDGTPHVVPLWYEWDGEAMWLAASPGSSWRAYVADNPHVSVTLDEPWPPLRRAFLYGIAAEVDPDAVPDGVSGLRRRLAVRYLGRGADSHSELSDSTGWAAIRIVPDRMHGRQGLGLARGERR